MDQEEQRKKFVMNLHKFCQTVELNKSFIECLKQHSNSYYLDEMMKFKEDMSKKLFIFLEFTRVKSTCDEMVEILRKSGQIEAASKLEEYNCFSGFMPETDKIELQVIPATILRSGGSKNFIMDQNPRGLCLIINNVQGELEKESSRFKYIFEQLHFDVEICDYMTAKEMESRLKALSNEERLKRDNALIIMIIGHGRDEKVCGYDGYELKISNIVDIFSENNCRSMSRKPKLFFFNCCKITSNLITEKKSISNEIETIGQTWINENRYTMICYSCAEGFKSWYLPNQFTYFGKALSHCIAQFACEKSVQSIINLTSEKLSLTPNLPEIKCIKMTRELYFNPGFPKNKE